MDENLKATIRNRDHMLDQKQLENVQYFNYFGSTIASNTRCTGKI
jgi:hypothetical protein